MRSELCVSSCLSILCAKILNSYFQCLTGSLFMHQAISDLKIGRTKQYSFDDRFGFVCKHFIP